MTLGKEDLILFESRSKPNLILALDHMDYAGRPSYVQFELTVKKTLKARIKYWLLCKLLPFRIVRWDDNLQE